MEVMNTFNEVLDLVEAYREQFGDVPPIQWNEVDVDAAIKEIKAAMESGEPWKRPKEQIAPAEDILL